MTTADVIQIIIAIIMLLSMLVALFVAYITRRNSLILLAAKEKHSSYLKNLIDTWKAELESGDVPSHIPVKKLKENCYLFFV